MDPSVNKNINMRDHGRGKRPLKESDLDEARKKKKTTVTEAESRDDTSNT